MHAANMKILELCYIIFFLSVYILQFCFVYSVFCIVLVLFCLLFLLFCCLFPISVQVY